MNTIKHKQKNISILGDSISTLFGYSKPSEGVFYAAERRYETGVYYLPDTWWGQVTNAVGGRLLVNDSFAGSTVCFDMHNEIASYACGDNRTSALGDREEVPDVIMIFMGMNDRGVGVRLRPSCEAEDNDPTFFSEAYSAMLCKLKANYPQSDIWCLTLPLGSLDGYAQSDAARRKTEEYSKVIAECAARNGCRLIDICRMEPYESIDGLHPTAVGMKQIAEAVLSELRREGEL